MNTPATEIETRPLLGRRQAQSSDHIRQRPQPSTLRRKAANLFGGLALCLAASPLTAGELSVMAGESIDLGRFHGVVYFTSEDDLYRVVATIADGEAGLPVRFTANLAENQSATISMPGSLGEPGHRIEISRSGDKVTLIEGGRSTNVAASPEM